MPYYKRVKNKTYGPYEYSPRPIHHWTAKDLARIARFLKEHKGISAVDILIMVAIAIGFGTLFCKIAKALTAALSLSTFIRQVGTVLALSTFITTLIEFLLATKLIAPNWLKIILALLIALLMFTNKLFDSLSEMVDNLDIINEVSGTVYELCDRASELAGIVVDKSCEAISDDACYWAAQKAEVLAESLKSDKQKMLDAMDRSLIEDFWQLMKDAYHGRWGSFGSWWD